MDISGKILTVTGAINPDELGVTLTHEHLSMIYKTQTLPPPPGDEHKMDLPFTLENSGWIRQYPYSSHVNLSIRDHPDAVTKDVLDYKAAGGCSIVENSIHGLQRDMQYLVKVAERTGVKIIAGTGYYFDGFQPESVRSASVEELAKQITKDITDGWDGTHVRCGVIGEIGTSYPVTEFEKRSLRASVAVQQALGCPIIIHPGRDRRSPFEVMRVVLEAGGDPGRVVMSHLDRTLFEDEELLEFAKIGCINEYDLFGIEVSHYSVNVDYDMPSDAQRIQAIKKLIKEGYEDNIVIAHDIHTNHRLTDFGGHGYSHILKSVVPKMKLRGISQECIDKILIHTPKRWLTFK